MRNSQSPSVHSIYHNALPFYLDRVDLVFASVEEEAFANNFLSHLLQGRLSVQFDASNTAADKMRHLYFESKNLTRTLGARTFGFGFPLLIDTREGELLVAPVFIWPLSLEPAQTKVDAWVIRSEPSLPVQPNYQIIKHLREKFDTDYTDKYTAALSEGGLTAARLNEFCQDLADRFHLEVAGSSEQLLNAPGIDEIGGFTEKGALHWSGVLGIYPPQHRNREGEKAKPENVFVDRGKVTDPNPFVFPFLPADPEQVSALEMVLKNGVSVVEGIDTLGKSQTLVNVLAAALMQGKKCLVVSERVPALKRTQELLARAGIHQLNFFLADAINDRDQLLELLKLAAKGAGREVDLDENDFQYKKNKFIRENHRLAEAYTSVSTPIFGHYNWTDTVGLFLSAHRKAGRELLANPLKKRVFIFNIDESKKMEAGVGKCYSLFPKIRTLNHPLSNLNDRIFQQISTEEGRKYVEEQSGLFLKKATQLHHQYISIISGYKNNLKKHYEEYTQKLDSLYGSLHEKILGYTDQLGNDFLEAGPRAFQIPFLFSKKKKRIVAAQNDVAKGYRLLLKTFEKDPYFEFVLPSAKEGMEMGEVKRGLEGFKKAFDRWIAQLDDRVQKETNRLNSKTAHPALGVKEEMSQLEFSLDVLMEEINQAHLYQKPLENKTLTIPRRQRFLESIIEQLENTRLYLREFPAYYQWRSQWLQLGAAGQKVVRALVKVKPENWTAAFESWYFSNLLETRQKAALPTSLEPVRNYDQAWHNLKPLLLARINQVWHKRQAQSLRKLRKTNKSLFQAIFDRPLLRKKSPPRPLEELLDGSMEAITDLLPVLFVSSHVALNILPRSFTFDIVLFEEANRFSIEPATVIARLGKQVAIFGSNDTNGNETSLLQYALENGVPPAPITNRYETPDQFLSGPDHTTPPFAYECVVEDLEGRFHEMDNTNDSEAQHVIRLLNQIKYTPRRVYPSVGVVTFTIEQRDLIASYILKLKQQNALGSEKIRQLERNGMGVFFIEELYGQQFDILILCCTFGPVNIKGQLTKKLTLLNTPEGVSYMNLLINLPLNKLFLLHSFTDQQIESFANKKWDKGTWLLAQFIEMANAAAQSNEIKYLQAMEAIGKKERRVMAAPHFVEEVALSLHPYLDADRLQKQLCWEDVVLSLTIRPLAPKEPLIVLHPDGFFADTPHTSGIWEMAHVKKLDRDTKKMFSLWSLNWLKDPENEARKIASRIIKTDRQFAGEKSPPSPAGKNEKNTEEKKE